MERIHKPIVTSHPRKMQNFFDEIKKLRPDFDSNSAISQEAVKHYLAYLRSGSDPLVNVLTAPAQEVVIETTGKAAKKKSEGGVILTPSALATCLKTPANQSSFIYASESPTEKPLSPERVRRLQQSARRLPNIPECLYELFVDEPEQ